jgi:hypothetical protein
MTTNLTKAHLKWTSESAEMLTNQASRLFTDSRQLTGCTKRVQQVVPNRVNPLHTAKSDSVEHKNYSVQ